MCSKMHQISPKTSQWFYVPDKLLINETTIYYTWILKKRGNNKHTWPIFDSKFLASLKKKLCTRNYISQSNRRTYVITIPCVLCIVNWCLATLLWIYLQIANNKQRNHARSIYFPKFRMIQFTCTKDIFRILHGKEKWWCKKDITFTSFYWKRKIKKISVWYLIYK